MHFRAKYPLRTAYGVWNKSGLHCRVASPSSGISATQVFFLSYPLGFATEIHWCFKTKEIAMNSSIAFLYSIFLLEWKWHKSSRVPWLWAKDWFKAKQGTMVFRCFLTLQTALSYLWACRCQALLPEKQCRTPWFLFFPRNENFTVRGSLVPSMFTSSLLAKSPSHQLLLRTTSSSPGASRWHCWSHKKIWLVVDLPLWKIWKSVGMMTFPKYGKIIQMFQTTNQKLNSYWQTVGVDLAAPELLVRLERCF